ncbi:MAG: hypothetical protein KatS3mg102_1858 [Planctomycetota bacterium]|nr:MAG: hypothetical protein KatS3mg102_1858 [Planctomycetota bacterium]
MREPGERASIGGAASSGAGRASMDPAFEREVLRINERYVTEIVEAFGICPFARRARERGQIARTVLPQSDPARALGPALQALLALERTEPAQVLMGMFIFPCLRIGLRAFSAFAERLQQAYAARCGPARQFVGVVFHPGYALRATSPAAAVPWLRRSPDPTLQWTRHSALEAARRALPAGPLPQGGLVRTDPHSAVSARIAAANFALVTDEARRIELERIFADIAADRARSYARWLVP